MVVSRVHAQCPCSAVGCPPACMGSLSRDVGESTHARSHLTRRAPLHHAACFRVEKYEARRSAEAAAGTQSPIIPSEATGMASDVGAAGGSTGHTLDAAPREEADGAASSGGSGGWWQRLLDAAAGAWQVLQMLLVTGALILLPASLQVQV